MEGTNINLQLYDLTGQVSVVDGIAKFNGNYSSVLLGAFNGHYMAIKVIKAANGQHIAAVQRKLLREIVVWGSASHQNIHPFYGFANDLAFAPFGALISPWCRNGDASKYLSQNGSDMVMAARMDLWKGVIDGVVYLHGRNPPIVHGDLKPGNVLIDDAGSPRICDFGLARLLDNVPGTGMTTTSEHTGTTRYLAPELVASEESVPPTLASDMYALGCLGLEFIYLQSPFSHRPNNPRGHLMILQDLRRGLAPAITPPYSIWPFNRVWRSISELWRFDSFSRPSAIAVSQTMKCTDFTLPPNVARRVIALVDDRYSNSLRPQDWAPRTRDLRSLCLVSRAYCSWATPALYRCLYFTGNIAASTLHGLIYSLNNSITSPLACNHAAHGYGIYTEILVTSGTNNQNLQGSLSTTFRDLLHMMPRLRLVEIGDDQAFRRRSFATLSINYTNEEVFVVDERVIIPAFSYLQRLCIEVNSTDRLPCFPPASSRLFLPHLRSITITSYHLGRHYKVSSSFFLEALSGWKLPSLQCLYIHSIGETYDANTLTRFLWSHGAALGYLTLEHYAGYTMSQDMLRTILTLCTNLRSLDVYLENLPAFDLIPSHLNLEKLYITAKFDTLPEGGDNLGIVANHERLASFESTAPTLFPKLVEVKFRRYNPNLVTVFHTSDGFNTVWEDNRTPW